jgi:periplasmic protein TonB
MSELAAVDRLLCVPRPETKHGPWAPALALSLLMHSAGAAALLYRSTPQAQAFEAIEVEVIAEDNLFRPAEIPPDIQEGSATAVAYNEAQPDSSPPTAKPASDSSDLEGAASSEASPEIAGAKRETKQPVETDNEAKNMVAATPPAAAAVAVSGDADAESERRKASAKAFLGAISAELNRRRIYPAAARQRGLVGAVKVAFTVDDKGRVSHFDIIKSSGHRLLDDAVGKIMASMQTPPPPEGSFTTAVTIRFDLR